MSAQDISFSLWGGGGIELRGHVFTPSLYRVKSERFWRQPSYKCFIVRYFCCIKWLLAFKNCTSRLRNHAYCTCKLVDVNVLAKHVNKTKKVGKCAKKKYLKILWGDDQKKVVLLSKRSAKLYFLGKS